MKPGIPIPEYSGRPYDAHGFRTIGRPTDHHARTEYQSPDGRTFSASGQGDQIRAMLVEHAEGKR